MNQNMFYKKELGVINRSELSELHKGMSLPDEFDNDFLTWLGYSPVVIVERPSETELEYPVPDEKLVNGVYIKDWKMTNKPALAIAEAAKLKVDTENILYIRTEVKQSPLVVNLLKMSPIGIDQYIDTQITDIDSVKELLKSIMKIILPTGIREFK